jgi:hypothetical protein
MRLIDNLSQTNPKLLKKIIRGILGEGYSKISDIPEQGQQEIEDYLQQQERKKLNDYSKGI